MIEIILPLFSRKGKEQVLEFFWAERRYKKTGVPGRRRWLRSSTNQALAATWLPDDLDAEAFAAAASARVLMKLTKIRISN